MEKKFTAQEIINMGAELYDGKGFSRTQIRAFLTALVNNDWVEQDVNIETIFDMIVG